MNGVSGPGNVNAAIRMLQEMQRMAEQSRGGAADAQPAQQGGFGAAMRTAVDQVNTMQMDASAKTEAFTRGDDIPLTEVMVATQKSRVAFEATKQVRNHLVEAYRDIFNMPV
ncbi:flagellar hook-basal body complex protein FliE [Natronocella acetinitrilica]|jgi:flagellar hook-basal body complex protein FliE|uniref:Flagellar hook-basal body complex protein FliE n=1 Tax=Natronocella acetinitrilica TaxID=414046 RepID=A0AAE3KCC5_9GAMM|nr:flagellar hook-basal body complex protein FliE [Natronocella acetinitrilica]MCP1675606.1 flagellar hook-basal body complex protein FliE [Natronocella acetinitrilica]